MIARSVICDDERSQACSGSAQIRHKLNVISDIENGTLYINEYHNF